MRRTAPIVLVVLLGMLAQATSVQQDTFRYPYGCVEDLALRSPGWEEGDPTPLRGTASNFLFAQFDSRANFSSAQFDSWADFSLAQVDSLADDPSNTFPIGCPHASLSGGATTETEKPTQVHTSNFSSAADWASVAISQATASTGPFHSTQEFKPLKHMPYLIN